ncbi:class I SAM-dependent methyltransferase [Acuticoccus sp. M5D2P5]|uniref:class I SAM-dependent methyltransferase n=1 Tax=Acuticoccus kalidii TaxID=2910977 RepID=UPI001F3B422B|nr:class I SAM-dependent methyltransferase [Acuticoccus kalidii]MCF3936074.1 class I SAM-dependent methyltransferase [Acuticoccus kalidii]
MNADEAHWTKAAGAWIEWARRPGHDAFWAYRGRLAAFVGPGSGAALEVGCGEGRVSRLLQELGFRVTATEPVKALLAAAEEAGSAHDYRAAPADALPFEDASFDLVVAYNVLMDIVDVPAALREIRRVMRPSATLMISIVHPFADIGHFADDAAEAPFVITEPYFGRKAFAGTEARDGLEMPFFGWSQPLEAYAAALEAAGLAVTSLREPVPELRSDADPMARWTRLPLFLWLKARPLAR